MEDGFNPDLRNLQRNLYDDVGFDQLVDIILDSKPLSFDMIWKIPYSFFAYRQLLRKSESLAELDNFYEDKYNRSDIFKKWGVPYYRTPEDPKINGVRRGLQIMCEIVV